MCPTWSLRLPKQRPDESRIDPLTETSLYSGPDLLLAAAANSLQPHSPGPLEYRIMLPSSHLTSSALWTKRIEYVEIKRMWRTWCLLQQPCPGQPPRKDPQYGILQDRASE
ncbi:hypothetical protein Tco_0200365 [Tanacetum coccineum]